MKILNCAKPILLKAAALMAVVPVLISGLPAQAGDAALEETPVPLHVISDKMIARRDAAMVEFTGNVKATRLDSVVHADAIEIYFYSDGTQTADGQGSVKKIVSTGHVRYRAGDREAEADRAVYTTADQILVLTGRAARLKTGDSFVTGTKITLFRVEDKVIVESDGPARVEALFNPEDHQAGGTESKQ